MGQEPGLALQADSLIGASPIFSTNLDRSTSGEVACLSSSQGRIETDTVYQFEAFDFRRGHQVLNLARWDRHPYASPIHAKSDGRRAALSLVLVNTSFTFLCPCGETADTLRLERSDFGHAGATPARGTSQWRVKTNGIVPKL